MQDNLPTIEDIANAIGLDLTDVERDEIRSNPVLLSQLYKDASQAIALNHIKPVLLAQVVKGLKGDTAAAKFLYEIAQPPDAIVGVDSSPAEWEALAIELRNDLGLEISAEKLVVKLLNLALTMPSIRAALVD